MAATKKTCAACGDRFIGRGGAQYCSATCRSRGHRFRRAGKRGSVATVTRRRGSQSQCEPVASRRSAEALALIDALGAELASNGDDALEWSVAERQIIELAADTIDRRAELRRLYVAAADEPKLRLKVAGELRLIEAALARLLRMIKTDLPAPPSGTSRKASHAAQVRWDRAPH